MLVNAHDCIFKKTQLTWETQWINILSAYLDYLILLRCLPLLRLRIGTSYYSLCRLAFRVGFVSCCPIGPRREPDTKSFCSIGHWSTVPCVIVHKWTKEGIHRQYRNKWRPNKICSSKNWSLGCNLLTNRLGSMKLWVVSNVLPNSLTQWNVFRGFQTCV